MKKLLICLSFIWFLPFFGMNPKIETYTFKELFGRNIPAELISKDKDINGNEFYRIDLSGETLTKKYHAKLSGSLNFEIPYYVKNYCIIDLSNNELEEINLSIKSRVKHLNLSDNKLKKVSFSSYSYSYGDYIEELDLSNNRLEKIPKNGINKYIRSCSFPNRIKQWIEVILKTSNDISYKCCLGAAISSIWIAKKFRDSEIYYTTKPYYYYPLEFECAFWKWVFGLPGLGGLIVIFYDIFRWAKLDYREPKYDSKNILSIVNNIQKLNLSNNNITEIGRYIKFYKNLEALNLSGNNIKKLPFELTKLSKITELNLLGNPLGESTSKFNFFRRIIPCGSINNACKQPVPFFYFIPALFGKNIKNEKLKQSRELYQFMCKLRTEGKLPDARQINIVTIDGIKTGFLNTSPLQPNDPALKLRKIAAKIPYHVIEKINGYIYDISAT